MFFDFYQGRKTKIILLQLFVALYKTFHWRMGYKIESSDYLLTCPKTTEWVANSTDPDHFATSGLGLQCFLRLICSTDWDFMACQAGQFTWSPFSSAGLVLKAVNQYLCTFFRQRLTTALLESAETYRKYGRIPYENWLFWRSVPRETLEYVPVVGSFPSPCRDSHSPDHNFR